MKRILWAFTAAALLAFGACEATDEGTDATTTGDQAQTCTATAENVYAGCIKFRDALCKKLVACSTFGDKIECGNWFDGEDGFGGCDPDFTDPIASPAKFEECICSIPSESCQAIGDGVLTALPACGEWTPGAE